MVSLGKPTSRLDGQNCALQEAWRKASITIDEPGVDDVEHKLELDIKEELMAVAERYRSLTTAHYNVVRVVAEEDKMLTRTSFNELENQLI